MEYLYGQINYERVANPGHPFRLARMRSLLNELGNPDRDLAIVHIGGTKGKGSTSTMVAAMLTSGGVRTGLYTSPHLNQLGERFRVDGKPCAGAELVSLVAAVREAAERMERDGKGAVTFFELTTAIGLLHFKRSGCRAAVLEVGLGGRLDSTNVCTPEITALTSVGLDHQHILGERVEQIALEKAGIFKAGIPAISGVASGPAADVIQQVAESVGAPLFVRERDFKVTEQGQAKDWGILFDYSSRLEGGIDRTSWSLPLEGAHQAENAAVALAIVDALAARGSLSVSLEDQRSGLENVFCPARIERFQGSPTVLLDAAHNDDSVAALVQVIERRRGGRRVAVLFGTSQDKDATAQLKRLLPVCENLVITRFHENPRWQNPEKLLAICEELAAENAAQGDSGKMVSPHWVRQDDPVTGLALASQLAGSDGLVVVCGSFFLAAELRPLLVSGSSQNVPARGVSEG